MKFIFVLFVCVVIHAAVVEAICYKTFTAAPIKGGPCSYFPTIGGTYNGFTFDSTWAGLENLCSNPGYQWAMVTVNTASTSQGVVWVADKDLGTACPAGKPASCRTVLTDTYGREGPCGTYPTYIYLTAGTTVDYQNYKTLGSICYDPYAWRRIYYAGHGVGFIQSNNTSTC